MISEALLTGALGGLLSLDRFQAFQTMISRPLVAGAVVGAALGDLCAGLASGVVFEMLWLRATPTGGFVPPDPTLGVVAVSAVASMVRRETGAAVTPIVCLSFLLLFPVSLLGARLDDFVRVRLGDLARRAEQDQMGAHRPRLWPYMAAALALGFLVVFLTLPPVALAATIALSRLWPCVPSSIVRGLSLTFYVIPLLGVADLMVRHEEARDWGAFVVGFVAAVVTAMVLAAT